MAWRDMDKALHNVLLLEPFYGGSHKQLVDLINSELLSLSASVDLVTMSAKKWHWRARTAALYLQDEIPYKAYRLIWASAVLNLSELLALRPDLNSAEKLLYFHENQLVYPVRNHKERDFQYGYNQIISCFAADRVVFNSQFNMAVFLDSISGFLKLIPDYRPKCVAERIRQKCLVLYFPILVAPRTEVVHRSESNVLHIAWPHRWEHDKNPETFFAVLDELVACGLEFRLVVLGEHSHTIPEIFRSAKEKFKEHAIQWGYLDSKQDYWETLQKAHVVVSTANHEFFGAAMVEAAYLGCFPVCPNRLVYPEIFPNKCLYNTDRQLLKMLKNFCKHPYLAAVEYKKLDFQLYRFEWENLRTNYKQLLGFFDS